jgi:hypothetical protein
MRLDRNTIHWDNTGLGLQQTTGALVNATLREESIETFPAHSWKTTACTVSKRPNSIWRQETIRNTKIDNTFGRQQSQTVHTPGMRKMLIPWQSSGQHPTLPDQRNCITIIQTNRRHDAVYTSTPSYLATQEDAVFSYHASDMVLAVHSNASYLSEPEARSRVGGHFFLSSDTTIPPKNGAVLNIAHIIKNVMSSATEAELAGLYIMTREAVYIRFILIQMDNAMADAVINGKIQPKRTKAMDMRFHWLRDRECQ